MKDQSIFYEEGPKAVLLFHSYAGGPNVFFSLANALRREGYTVYAPVLSGHQEDLEELFDYNFTHWTKDQEEAVQFLRKKGYKDISAFGLSIGGVLAVRSLVQNSDFSSGGTFCSPMINNPDHFFIIENFLPYYLKSLKDKELPPAAVEQKRKEAEKKLHDFIDSMSRVLNEIAPKYKDIKQPVFIAQGGKDEVIHPEIALNFRSLLTNSNFIDYYYAKNGGHLLSVGKDGAELNKRLLQFLTTCT